MKSKTPTVYLVDISSLFFRSFYAISLNMKNEKGLPTNALYGVLKMINLLIRSKNPDYIVCCFDTKEGSFYRKKLYPEYKANRSEMPKDLKAQVPHLKTLLQKLQIPCWQKQGVEADDLIASLVSFLKPKNWQTFIISGDKDFAQIVDTNVFLYDTMKEVVYDPQGVQDKWGLPPSQIQDYLSLMGDSSDNIPGVRGVGSKTAIKLLKDYKSLQEIYENLSLINSSVRNKLIENKEMALLSQQLVELIKDIPADENFFKHTYKNFSNFSQIEKQELKVFLEELNFKSFLKKQFSIKTESPKPTGETQWEEKTNPTEIQNTKLTDKNFLSVKAKQSSLQEFKNKLEPYAKVQIGTYKDQFYLLSKKCWVLVSQEELKNLSDFLDYKWVRYIGHDLKYFWKILQVKNPVAQWDSMLAGHLLSSTANPSLTHLFEMYLQLPEATQLNLSQFLQQEQQLYKELLKQLEQEEMLELYEEIELPLIAVLYDMEQVGFCLDLQEITTQSDQLNTDIQNLEFQIHKLAGENFNLSSPKQLGEILFEKLQLPKGRKTKTGYSTDSHELIKMKQLHPILPLLLKHREFFKLKSTYTDPLIQMRNPNTGRIYTEFKQTVTSTGRLSSLNPNLQNIPIRTDRGRLIRKAFTVDAGKELICADYSQVELRILAEITGDENLKKAFENNLDIHAITASEVFNVPLKEVSGDLRRKSKAINFGIAYGQGAYGLAENLSISRTEAKEIVDNYFKKFKKIKDYIESVKQDITKQNYVKTLYGRKRYFNTEDLKNPRLKAGIERAAINAPLQGTASDLIKKAMIKLNESLSIPILSQVHDELLFEAPIDSVKRNTQEIIQTMEDNPLLKIPMKLNVSTGKNWYLTSHN